MVGGHLCAGAVVEAESIAGSRQNLVEVLVFRYAYHLLAEMWQYGDDGPGLTDAPTMTPVPEDREQWTPRLIEASWRLDEVM